MKQMNLKEFQNRLNEVAKARKIFINSGLTKNVTHAFQLYQDIFAEEEMAAFISGKEIPSNILKERCPECDGALSVRQRCSGMGAGDYISVIKCVRCGYYDLSEKVTGELLEA
ncbi:MAG: hypothetical protein JXB42_01685 [Deltaproteobacteria bacterium]|nr:hypothetical protein [Deltaproteobacteria bacterium]